jgi:hypothetical protein
LGKIFGAALLTVVSASPAKPASGAADEVPVVILGASPRCASLSYVQMVKKASLISHFNLLL